MRHKGIEVGRKGSVHFVGQLCRYWRDHLSHFATRSEQWFDDRRTLQSGIGKTLERNNSEGDEDKKFEEKYIIVMGRHSDKTSILHVLFDFPLLINIFQAERLSYPVMTVLFVSIFGMVDMVLDDVRWSMKWCTRRAVSSRETCVIDREFVWADSEICIGLLLRLAE